MRIRIRNILGLTDFEAGGIDADRPVWISGPNASGKTSAAKAIAAVLSRETNPMHVSAAARRAYLNAGADSGSVELEDGAGSVRWDVPSAQIAVSGEPTEFCETPAAVAGLVDFVAPRSAKERQGIWEGLLLRIDPEALPGLLRDALGDKLDAKAVEGVIEVVRRDGWEKAGAIYKDRLRKQKAEWCEIAHKRQFGSAVASEWRPDGFRLEWDTVSVVQAEAELEDALAAAQERVLEGAVSEAERKAADEAAARIPELEERAAGDREAAARQRALVDDGEEKRRQLRDAYAKALDAVKELARRKEQNERVLEGALNCPECDAVLMVSGRELVKFERSSADAALRESSAELEKALQRRNEAKRELDSMSEVCGRATQTLYELDEAKSLTAAELGRLRQLAAAAEKPAWSARAQAEADSAEQYVREARVKLEKVKQKRAADEAAQNAWNLTAVVDLLGAGGLRKRLAAEARGEVNIGLQAISIVTGWPRFYLEEDCGVTMGEPGSADTPADLRRPVELCSGSERWRAQACLQISLALYFCKQDRPGMFVVLDGADVLDDRELANLAKLIVQRGHHEADTASPPAYRCIVTGTAITERAPREMAGCYIELREGRSFGDGDTRVSGA